MPIHRELNHDFFKKWSPEMAYILGFFAADGSMIKNKRGGHFIEFTITDRIVLEIIQNAIESTHKIQKRTQKNDVWKTQYRIQIGSKEWFEDLSRFGFSQNKSKKLQLPEVPKKYFGDFVRGYFDGDGCVYFSSIKFADRKNPRLVLMTLFTSGSRPFLEKLHSNLLKSGIKGGHISNKNRGHDLVFSRRDSLALYRLMYHTGKVTDMFLPRKRKKLEKAIKILGLDK